MPAARRVYFETYGCTTNEGDTRTMQGVLVRDGHQVVDTPDAADLIVVNTCTVVDTTDEKIGHRLRMLSAAGKQVIVAGCMAAAQPDRVRRDALDAQLLAPRHLHHIGDMAAGRAFVPMFRPKSSLPRAEGQDAILQLAEGCVFSCTYCLTKTARGDQSSYPIDELVHDAREAINSGATEIKLTAQDVSGYGFDGGERLPELVRRIAAVGGDFRVRVGMMHPRTAHRVHVDLIDAMDAPNVYKFLHLPIQSGSERILKAMGRDHTLDEFWTVVDAFRERFPEGTVSTDIITAFPGETEEDHAATRTLLRRLRAEHVNVTRFSARPGTPAKTMADRVPTQVAKARSTELARLALDLMHDRYQRYHGTMMDVLVTGPGDRPGTMRGRGPGHEPVVVVDASAETVAGVFVPVQIERTTETYLVAKACGAVRRPSKLPLAT